MNKKNDKKVFQNLALITQIGLSIIAPILLGVYLGGVIDKFVGTQMAFRLIFIILGAGAGFLNLLKLANKKDNKRK
ncbi:AtpZ/AtpI family protein [Schnuerera sp. xch1]|uniref:AtpZ/AtpI family protein n=1 Tax=Schnuerera sp. xch1 TaxID=2874283 RepID=UPI001CBDA99B|nr:AtpZ/AtpI family protein [Schnuerera sp. xch1]MBZ2174923.1 AtpZ/AtpI family protein [Schnuerera sp. xch1]